MLYLVDTRCICSIIYDTFTLSLAHERVLYIPVCNHVIMESIERFVPRGKSMFLLKGNAHLFYTGVLVLQLESLKGAIQAVTSTIYTLAG